MRDHHKHPFQFVLRGLPQNSFKVLAQKITEYGCPVIIDPLLFEKYGITQVPCFVWEHKGKTKGVYGNVTLDYALAQMGYRWSAV